MTESSRVQRILVADDDPNLRQLLAFNLEAEGFEVLCVEHGGDVCPTLRASRCDLLLLDVMMPVADGLDVLRELRSDALISNTPVVLLTAKATDQEVWAGWQAGADYYVTKPFDLDEILNFVRYLGVELV